LDGGIEFCLRGDFEVEEFEGAGLGGGWPGEDCCWVCVAEADAVTGQVGEVLQEGAEAVNGMARLPCACARPCGVRRERLWPWRRAMSAARPRRRDLNWTPLVGPRGVGFKV